MEYLTLTLLVVAFTCYIANKRSVKRKAELTVNINARLSQIDKHLSDQFYLLECFRETMDKSFLDYGDEELKKAAELVRLNELDLIEIKKL